MSIFTVGARGIGKPDYSKEIHAGRERAGISLKYNQELAIFATVFTDQIAHPSPIAWVQPPLASGAPAAHLYDTSTGLVTPYTLPAGYTLALAQNEWASSEDVEIWIYYDGMLIGCPGITPPGANFGWNMVVMLNTITLDPTAASPHTLDLQIINAGAGNLEGAFDIIAIIEKVGSPEWPTTKNCRCPFCSHVQTVPVGTTKITCEKCHKTYLVYDFSKIRVL